MISTLATTELSNNGALGGKMGWERAAPMLAMKIARSIDIFFMI